jgi:hypothetical protein
MTLTLRSFAMTKESRYGPAVRERTKLLAALMRTPDDGLLTFAQANELSEALDLRDLERARDLLDAVGRGLRADAGDAFWQRLEAALAILEGEEPVTAAVPPPPPAAAAPPAAVPSAAVPSAAVPSAAVPSAAVPSAASPAAARPDFRHDVMDKAPPPRSKSAGAPQPWRPHDPKVRRPEPGQEATAVLETGEEGTLRILAATTAGTWPLKRVVRLEAAYAAYLDRGDPSMEDICQFFELPNERAVKVALRTWQRRLEEDEELADEHASLLETIEGED